MFRKSNFFRKPEILKDRDLIGELKDSWYSVQAVREKEKAEIYTDTVEVFGPVVKANEITESIISDLIPQSIEQYTDKDQLINETSFDEHLIANLTINEISPDDQLSKVEAQEHNVSKESQNIFFTKVRNGSKEKEIQSSDDTRLKPKKSLNFFRKNKCTSQSTKNDKNKNESVSAK